jgi:hypothetical protein
MTDTPPSLETEQQWKLPQSLIILSLKKASEAKYLRNKPLQKSQNRSTKYTILRMN